jgi:hypothetical protein
MLFVLLASVMRFAASARAEKTDPVTFSSLVQCRMARLFFILLLFAALSGIPAGADIPVDGGCALGESQLAHGLSAADSETRIKQYARLYVQSYRSYNRQKSDTRRQANDYMELDAWTQNEIIGFTRLQRELLYISVGGELAVGKIDSSELPGYVAAIDQKIREIEVELGCQLLPGEAG